MEDRAEVLSIRTRKIIWGAFGWAFTSGAVLRVVYGDVLFPVLLGVFALAAFILRWMTGKWWAEL